VIESIQISAEDVKSPGARYMIYSDKIMLVSDSWLWQNSFQ